VEGEITGSYPWGGQLITFLAVKGNKEELCGGLEMRETLDVKGNANASRSTRNTRSWRGFL